MKSSDTVSLLRRAALAATLLAAASCGHTGVSGGEEADASGATASAASAPASGPSAPGPSAPGPSAPGPSAPGPSASAPSASAPSAAAPAKGPTPPQAPVAPVAPEATEGTAVQAQNAPQVAQSSNRPPTLATGHDLSSIRLPTTNPVAPPTPAAQPPATSPTAPAMEAVPEGPLGHVAFANEEDQTHDFGSLLQGDVAEHRFEFSNDGEGDLYLTQIKPSCGCTVAQTSLLGADGSRTAYVPGQPIAPGTRIELLAKLNTAGKRGPVHSNIHLYGNDERKTVALMLQADVKTFLDIDPPSLSFEKMRTDEVREGVFVVTSQVVDRFQLTYEPFVRPTYQDSEHPGLAGLNGAEEHQNDGVQVDLVPTDPDADGKASRWEARVTLGPGLTEGTRSIPVTLLSDVEVEGAPVRPDGTPARHQALGHVIAQITGLVDVEPRYMSFGLVRPGQVVSRSVTVKSYDETWQMAPPTVAVSFFRDFAHADKIRSEVRAIQEGKEYEVVLTLDGIPEDFVGSVSGRLTIETGHASKPTVEVNFSGICRGVVEAPVPTPAQVQAERASGGGEADGHP